MSSPKPNITFQQYAAASHSHVIPSIVEMHADVIQHDNSLLRFHPPFDDDKRKKMAAFWSEQVKNTENGSSIIVLAYMGDKPDLCGMGILTTRFAETGPFRAGIEFVMVSPKYQRKGIASRLMLELERVARENRRSLLRLGTTKDSAADLYLYPKLGYVKIGEVPRYGIEPGTGKLVDGVEYYKHLDL